MIGRPQRSFVCSHNMLSSLTFQTQVNSSHRLIRKFGDVPNDLNACEVSVRSPSFNFSDVSNIDHRLRQSEEHAGFITVSHIVACR